MSRLSLDSVHQRVYPIADLLVSRHPLIGSLFINHSKDQTYLSTAEVITLYVAVLPRGCRIRTEPLDFGAADERTNDDYS
jgi:hypothetical protein